MYAVCEGKCRVHSGTGHDGPQGEWRYSSPLSLTSALDGVGNQRHTPEALPPRRSEASSVYVTQTDTHPKSVHARPAHQQRQKWVNPSLNIFSICSRYYIYRSIQ